MKRLMLAGLLAVAVALTGTAYAEVQNIKVGGDIDLKATSHHNFDLKNETQANFATGTVANLDDENFYLSTVRVWVDADLTDNVSTRVRLLNQRKWDTDAAGASNINIDNAYVTLKEFLYSPLTLIAGRQDLNYGTGFIVGPGLLNDPETIFGGARSREFSAYNAYDAVRVILDYSPVTIEALIAKINESNTTDRDQNLYGVVVTYKLDRWNGEVAPYWFWKDDRAAALTVHDNGRTYNENDVHTIGAWASLSPMENVKLHGEGAYQFGELRDNDTASPGFQERDRSAFGANIDANYTWTQVPWTPVTGVGWVYFSGEKSNASDGITDQNDDYGAWDSMYRGQFFTAINDFLAGTDGPGGLYATVDPNDTGGATNRHVVYFDLWTKPMQDLTAGLRYSYLWVPEAPTVIERGSASKRDSELGHEIDGKVEYAYTDDVKLGLIGAIFLPGNYYDGRLDSNTRSDDNAWEVVGSASVKF